MINMILAFVLSWFCTLSGVALGGFLVFRTKRDDYEPLIPSKRTGEAFNIDEEQLFPQAEQSSAEIPSPIESQNRAFMEQFAETLAQRDTAK